MKRELHYFIVSLTFFTRLPVPFFASFEVDDLNKSTKYFTFSGAVIGLCVGAFYLLLSQFFSLQISVALSMAFSVLLTGAFHEDGFADMCDAFGGGYTHEKKLEIMKDSRLGTYGTTGLIFIYGLKFLFLTSINYSLFYIFFMAHTLSRLIPLLIMKYLPYVADKDKSKSKPMATRVRNAYLCVALLPCIFFLLKLPLLYVPLLFGFGVSYHLFKKHLNGYTGDCLGASQQMTELSLYLTCVYMFS